ncbi:GrpE, mitochondrial [Umbelopsis sp. WA50703]
MSAIALIKTAAVSSARMATVQKAAPTLSWAIMSRRAYATDNNGENTTEAPKQPASEEATEKKTEAGKSAEELTAALAEKEKKLAEIQDAYLRCLADQENLRVRTRKEITQTQDFAIQKFAKDLLDTVDILGMALQSVPENLRNKEEAAKHDLEKLADQLSNLYTGVSMTETELLKILKRHGVERYSPEGEVFDPNLHQALFQTPIPDKEAGTVFSVQKAGFMLKDRVLRPAQVGVVAEQQ